MLPLAWGVAHEPQSLPDVERPDAASWNNKRPAGVTCGFQVIENNVDPGTGSFPIIARINFSCNSSLVIQ
jgi:hypothetical protein